MIAQIKGVVLETTPLQAIIEAGGLGYEVNVPITTSERIPSAGKEVKLYTYSVYREDSATLYGFATRDDREFFKLIVEKVSGIGPKIAITMLSRMSTQTLSSAIASADVALLSKCPGIGKKTAERLVIELKDKIGLASAADSGIRDSSSIQTLTGGSSTHQDTVASLITLGYKPAEADKLVRKASVMLGAEATVEELLRKALS